MGITVYEFLGYLTTDFEITVYDIDSDTDLFTGSKSDFYDIGTSIQDMRVDNAEVGDGYILIDVYKGY